MISILIVVVVIGESGVGKTGLLTQWIDGKLLDSAATLNCELHTKSFKIHDDVVKVSCWDTGTL